MVRIMWLLMVVAVLGGCSLFSGTTPQSLIEFERHNGVEQGVTGDNVVSVIDALGTGREIGAEELGLLVDAARKGRQSYEPASVARIKQRWYGVASKMVVTEEYDAAAAAAGQEILTRRTIEHELGLDAVVAGEVARARAAAAREVAGDVAQVTVALASVAGGVASGGMADLAPVLLEVAKGLAAPDQDKLAAEVAAVLEDGSLDADAKRAEIDGLINRSAVPE